VTRIQIYTTRWCGYCVRAKALLDQKGIAYEEVPLDDDPGFRRNLFDLTGGWTVPQILIDGTAIGGYTELRSSGRRCACEAADRCAGVCASTLCIGDAPDNACERCFLPLMLNPPESCLQRACDLPDGGCRLVGICGFQATDCEELLSCLKECPPL
jgi:glutaredoxin 3